MMDDTDSSKVNDCSLKDIMYGGVVHGQQCGEWQGEKHRAKECSPGALSGAAP